MLDQLQIGNLYSYDDFEASVAKRKISKPKKKSIKDTVPFSNLTYDFSAINGEIYYEERSLEYVFEITADSPEELEESKMTFSSWVMNVMNEKLYDPFIEGYHFIATYDDMSCDDDESMDKSTITVKFTAYPYMIANYKKEIVIPIYAYEEDATKIVNNSSHRITPTFNSDIPFVLEVNGNSYGIPSGEVKDESFKIESGVTEIIVRNNGSENDEVKLLGKNLLYLDRCELSRCSNNNGVLTSEITDHYYSSIFIHYLNDFLLANKGKTLSFSTNVGVENSFISVVIHGNRTSGQTYQEQNSYNNMNTCSIVVADDFESITRVELRWNRRGAAFTDTISSVADLQLEMGMPTKYEPFQFGTLNISFVEEVF